MTNFEVDEKGMLDLACALIAQKTVNPPGNEHLVRDIVLGSMRELGMKTRVLGDKERPNILGEIGEGHPCIAILAHVDVVPPGEGWETDPFKPEVKDGRLYGRGASDDKGPYAASWAAVKALLEITKPKGKIILGAVSDEETGSERGVKLLLAQKELNCDYCFIPDVGKIQKAVIGEKGILWLKLVSRGKQAHGSNPEKGINAIWKMIEFLPCLEKLLPEQEIEEHFTPLDSKHLTRFTPLTLNLGKLKGGEAPNMVPSRCEAVLDIRYPLGIGKEDVIGEIQDCIDSFCGKNKEAHIELEEILQETVPHIVDPRSLLIQAFLQAGKELGHKIELTTIGGNSVAKILYFAGIPSFSHSPEDISVAHQANESVSLENLKKCAILWTNFLSKIISGEAEIM